MKILLTIAVLVASMGQVDAGLILTGGLVVASNSTGVKAGV